MDTATMKKVALGLGLAVVVGTHVGMLLDVLPMNTSGEKQAHAYANLGASGLIIYAFM